MIKPEFSLKRTTLKFLEIMGFGISPYFSLCTQNLIFINFKLTEDEAKLIEQHLPSAIKLKRIRFFSKEEVSHYWLSYHFYDVFYPIKEIKGKSRCDIITFVEDQKGRKGIYVLDNSPFVSKENGFSITEVVERIVMFTYSCGQLIPLKLELTNSQIEIGLVDKKTRIDLKHKLRDCAAINALSSDYWEYIDISFLNNAKTYDLVSVNSQFYQAKFSEIKGEEIDEFSIKDPFLNRNPDFIYYYPGKVSYLLSSLHLS